MADLSDVCAYLRAAIATAVYPNGTSQPSVAATDCRIYEGWPIPDQLDQDMAGKTLAGSPPMPTTRTGGPVANVSIYPMQGATATPYQILDKTYTITPPAYGLTVTSDGTTITVSGTPTAGEYLTIVANRSKVYSETGATASAIIAALAADLAADFPGATHTGSTLTIPNLYELHARQGAVATLGKVTHRQKQSIMVTVWAPTHASRSAFAGAIDVVLKETNRITMPDTSQAIVVYNRTNQTDEQQAATIYRRDLIYDVEYATLQTFPGYVVTSFDLTISQLTDITAPAAQLTIVT